MNARTHFFSYLLTIAERGDHISDSDFADCCYRAISEHGFDAKSLSTSLDIGPASFERWITGSNLPHPLIRGKILLAIANILKST